MIDEVLKKAENNKKLSDEEYIQLLKIDNREDLDKLCNIAVKIRDENIDQIKLTSTIHITNKCQIYPRCKYCGFATETSTDGYYDSFSRTNMRYWRLQNPLRKQEFLGLAVLVVMVTMENRLLKQPRLLKTIPPLKFL